MPSVRTILKQAVFTMATMFALNLAASNLGGTPRSIIKGEQPLLSRIKAVFTG